MADTFFITTAIDYTNAPPHIGHAYEKILADVLARYHRIKGEDVYFLTGVDQHGQKVQKAASAEGVEPQAFVDRLSVKFTELWEKLEVQYDGWAATTDPMHKACVQEILQALKDAGEIYQAPYKGFYSERQEQFLTDKERGPDGEFGAEWGKVVELEETNWYFRLTNYKEWLIDFIKSTPGLVVPEYRQRELLNAAQKLEGDLSISRPKARLGWGIELPFDRDCVTYVWFDALVNYVSFIGYRQGKNDAGALKPQFDAPAAGAKWPALHVIGKDILSPAHGIYWLCMLKAMGFSDAEMPRLLVHGYVLVDGEKMSKSIGNTRDPHAFADKFGVEALRYYLMRDCSVGGDMDFTDDRLVQRFNTDLANSLGNLLNRTLNMAQKYRGGKLVRHTTPPGPSPDAHIAAYKEAMDAHLIHKGLESAMAIAVSCNQYIDQEKPFSLAKDPAQAARLDGILYHLAETLRIISILISPVLPKAASGILAQLGVTGDPRLQDAVWGGLADGHQLGTPTPLFPRLELADAKPA